MPAECRECTHRGLLAGVWRHVLSGSEGAWFPRALPVWIKDDRSGGRVGSAGSLALCWRALDAGPTLSSRRDSAIGLVLDRYENCPSALMWHVRRWSALLSQVAAKVGPTSSPIHPIQRLSSTRRAVSRLPRAVRFSPPPPPPSSSIVTHSGPSYLLFSFSLLSTAAPRLIQLRSSAGR